MRRTLIFLLVLTATVLYSLVVYSWWVEGSANLHRQSDDADYSISNL